MDSNISILLIDDHKIVVDGCRMLLEQNGFQSIAVATDCEQGLDLAVKQKPTILITDISMPGMGGLGVIRCLKKQNLHTKIIVFSMYDDTVIVMRALDSGVESYVSKTNSPSILIEAIKSVLVGKIYISHDIAQNLILDKLNPVQKDLKALSAREFEIFDLLVNGHSINEIASTLQLSIKSISNYITKIKNKLDVDSTVALVHLGYEFNITKKPIASAS